MTPRRLLVAALVIAAVAIAITFWVGNAGSPKASDCVPQPAAAKKVDAAATGQLAALNGTGTGRGYADYCEAAFAAYEAAMFPRSASEAAAAHQVLALCLGERGPAGIVDFLTGAREPLVPAP